MAYYSKSPVEGLGRIEILSFTPLISLIPEQFEILTCEL